MASPSSWGSARVRKRSTLWIATRPRASAADVVTCDFACGVTVVSMRPLLLLIAFGALGAGVAGALTHGADHHAVSLGAMAGALVGLLVDLAFHLGDRRPAGSA